MARLSTRVITVVALGIVAGCVFVGLLLKQTQSRTYQLRREVTDLIRTNTWPYLSDNTELEALIRLRPEVLPCLSEWVDWRETALHRTYERVWLHLPAWLRNHLQSPREAREMHRKTVQIVHELGPAAARPLTSVLCKDLTEPDWQITTYALRSLYWSIPESPRSIAALTNFLSDPTHSHLFGNLDGWDLYPQVRQITPLLIPCLKNRNLVREAAAGLGKVGSNALVAIPALIEVCDYGVAQPPLKLGYTITYSGASEPYIHNRCEGFHALAQIGITSPPVLAALDRGVAASNDDIRFAALRAWAALGQPLDGRLMPVLKTFPMRTSIKFKDIVDWVATLGTNGREALPWLREIVSLSELRNLPDGTQGNTGDFQISPNDLRRSAMLAICRIDDEQTHEYLPKLLLEVGQSWEAVQFLMESKSRVPEISRGLEDLLQDTNGLRATVAAYALLALRPNNGPALETLQKRAAQGQLNDRLIAAHWLWKRSGEGSPLLSLCIEGLASPQSHIGQHASDALAEMGTAARPAIPSLKSALWHSDRFVRERAGKALRKLAPEEMPPIR